MLNIQQVSTVPWKITLYEGCDVTDIKYYFLNILNKGQQGGQMVLVQMFEDAFFSLTVVLVIEDNELLPCVLHHHVENDIVKVDRWSHEERVVVRLARGGRGAAGARGTRRCPLDEQMGNVHGVS